MSKTIDWAKTIPVWQNIPQIKAVWVLGSAQEGEVSEESDIDIGVYTNPELSFVEQLELMGQLQAVLQFEAVDLIMLNQANPILRFEAVSGRLLFCRDRQAMAGFVSLTAREYEDEMAQWQRSLHDNEAVASVVG